MPARAATWVEMGSNHRIMVPTWTTGPPQCTERAPFYSTLSVRVMYYLKVGAFCFGM